MAEIPGERAQDRGVDRVELLLGERLDQQEGPLARLLETVGDPLAQIGLRGRRDAKQATQVLLEANASERILPSRMKVDGANALVVGGASGLGEATARMLHADGPPPS